VGIVFPYTRIGPEYRRPLLFGVLRREDRFTPPVSMLLDTGSDFCMFDTLLATQFLGLDIATLGERTTISGIEGESSVYIHPIQIHIRDLGKTFNIEKAYFGKLAFTAGILGHNGFLDQINVKFSKSKSFEID
jgi:hypothetical protein